MKSLRNKLLASFLPIVAIGILLPSAFGVIYLYKQEHETLTKRLHHFEQIVELEIADLMQETWLASKLVVSDNKIYRATKINDRRGLLEILQRFRDTLRADAVEVIAPDGTVLVEAHHPTRHGQDDSYKELFKQSLSGQVQKGVAQSDLGLGVEIFLPIMEKEEVIGVLEVSRLFNLNFLNNLKTKYGIDLILYDGDRLQSTTFSSTKIIMAPPLQALSDEVKQTNSSKTEELKLDNVMYLVTAKPFHSDEGKFLGVMILALSHQKAHELMRNNVIISGMIALATLMITALICLRTSHLIVQPLGKLTQVTKQIADGDLSRKVEITSQDEVGELAHSFNEMSVALQGSTTTINNLNKEIAARQEAEYALRQAQKMEVIGTLAGGVAHDLNNILSGVVSYPELLLLDLPKDSPYRKPIQLIQDSGKKVATIVQDLLTLARRGVTVTDVTNLNILISDYLMSPECKELEASHSRIDVKVDLAKDLHNITGSPVHLTKSIMNLISNGMESISGKGTVCIKTENRNVSKSISGVDDIKRGVYAVLILSDTGIGIPASYQARIFEPFFTKKEMARSGTGLGLAIVWGTVHDHNGYIDIQSVEGTGTTFTLYFPITNQSLSFSDSSLSIKEYMGRGEKILVIDDDQDQRKIAAEMLTKLNYKVDTVASGEEAIEYLRTKKADLLILDMIMHPGIDGLATYSKILEYRQNQKAIIASGYSETDRVIEAQKAGAVTYIRKPYSMETIGVAVKEELKR
ncbi:MAG: response regulator [Desulfobulbaceae bacterium]|nr:response regulator [Desulfobulbaceae bacterium]